MFHPSWEAGCPHCSFWADNFNGVIVHLNHRDVTMIAASHAPYAKLAAYEKRMGWNFKWVSSFGTDFNFDYQASFTPEQLADKKAFYNYTIQDPHDLEHAGVSVFYKDAKDRVLRRFRTISRVQGEVIRAQNDGRVSPTAGSQPADCLPPEQLRRPPP